MTRAGPGSESDSPHAPSSLQGPSHYGRGSYRGGGQARGPEPGVRYRQGEYMAIPPTGNSVHTTRSLSSNSSTAESQRPGVSSTSCRSCGSSARFRPSETPSANGPILLPTAPETAWRYLRRFARRGQYVALGPAGPCRGHQAAARPTPVSNRVGSISCL